LEADREFGAYALFEALLRVGRPVPIELWTRVTGKILSLARSTGEDPIARRQVALSFDALLWRPCPVSQEQHRKLVDKLLKAGRRDQVLKAAFAAACSYHFRGYRRLIAEKFDPPLVAADGLSPAQAREMAWLVAWHFAHQSRCRAVVSRRTFQSTVETVDRVDDPRYLDRYRRQDPLDAEHETAVLHFAEALLEHRETAGWALHLIMNIHSTTGSFDVPDALIARFGEALKNDAPDPAVVSAALTYMPAEDIRKLLAPILKRDEGREALQRGLGQGVPIEPTVDGETTWVVEPHFAMSGDPWAVRKRWKAAPRKLPFGRSNVRELIERLDSSVDDAVEGGLVDRGTAEGALATLRRGDTRPLELSTRDRNLAHDNYPALLKFVCDYFEAAGNAR
ncbi:MAG TPA: hypothetical protein VFT10_08720, partial [Solirubrobacterales bacterium]|nr:hypothetical protein [Solirubrobacterales bacterium]